MTDLTHVEVRAGAYADSVTLLQVSRTVQGIEGVAAAQVAFVHLAGVLDVVHRAERAGDGARSRSARIRSLRAACAGVTTGAASGDNGAAIASASARR